MSQKQCNFRYDEEKIHKLKELAAKERTTIASIIAEQLDNYLKTHGDGNPNFILDQFINNPKMKACPALLRPFEDWHNYFKSADEKTIEDILNQAQFVSGAAQKQLKYGDSKTRVY